MGEGSIWTVGEGVTVPTSKPYRALTNIPFAITVFETLSPFEGRNSLEINLERRFVEQEGQSKNRVAAEFFQLAIEKRKQLFGFLSVRGTFALRGRPQG